ncbi:MAG: recO [Variovorax sp.]|nr:recO [Variovorax sp.]
MATHRVTHEPAYVLHRYDWSESSLILEVFTRHHGRIALVAKGAKRPSSNFRPVLLPLQPLSLNFGGDAEIRNLKGAEWMGGHVMPTGDALLSGYYVNELLLRLLARDDPHEALFDAYAGVVQVLAGNHGDAQGATQSAALRAFELLLLREVGLLPALDLQTLTLAPLAPGVRYSLVPEAGLREAAPDEAAALPGADWQALHATLAERAPFSATLRQVATLNGAASVPGPADADTGTGTAAIATAAPGAGGALRTQLRHLLNYHCGVSTLRTRQMMRDIQGL